MMVRRMRREAREGRTLPWALCVDGRLAGQVTVGGIAWGSLRSAYIGYWIDEAVAGRGIMPRAVAMAIDHCFDALHLHRVEINIRPENAASLRVVEKLGLRPEGDRPAYLHIDGDWRDHVTFVVLAGEFPEGMRARLAQRAAKN
jgi:ribosomal-protein-alanine N-acetyltransferase